MVLCIVSELLLVQWCLFDFFSFCLNCVFELVCSVKVLVLTISAIANLIYLQELSCINADTGAFPHIRSRRSITED